MAWLSVPDTQSLSAGQKLRVLLYAGYVEIGLSEDRVRQAIQQYTSLNVTSIAGRGLFSDHWTIEATIADNVPVAWVRSDLVNAVNTLRSELGVIAPGMEVGEIQVWQASSSDIIPQVPTGTAIALVAVALVAIVVFLFVKPYVR